MSIDSKLALLIMGLPLSILLSLGFGAYFVYGVDPEFISALISTVLVILLVWERLRGSLDKDLGYLHKTTLFPLYSSFRYGYDLMPLYTQKEIEALRLDLERYGRFMGIIRLFPKNLPKEIDELLSSNSIFYGNLQKIIESAKVNINIEPLDLAYVRQFCHYLGFNPQYYRQPDTEKLKQEYSEKAKNLPKKQLQLVNETKNLDENLRRMGAQIQKNLEDFFKRYNLRLEPEYPSSQGMTY